ncbi:hypothetical protein X801_07863, partial [Opisthorchis viverrini]
SDSSDDESGGKHRRRSGCMDDGEDEDPLLQLGPNSNDGSSKENQQPSSSPLKQNKTSSSPSTHPTSKAPVNVPNLRPRSTRCQRLRPSKDGKAAKRLDQSSLDPALAAKRKEVYAAAVKQAADGWSGRHDRFGQLLGRTRRPDYYKPIKVNWPLGSVRIYRLTDPSEAPRCECKPNSGGEPCGPSSGCINRELHYECLPSVCPNGDACQNQRFTKRLYPRQRPFWTGSERGWGLKTLVPIKAAHSHDVEVFPAELKIQRSAMQFDADSRDYTNPRGGLCGMSEPPVKQSVDAVDGIIVKAPGVQIKPHPTTKRGLERELEELVAGAVSCSPVKDLTASRTAKRIQSNNPSKQNVGAPETLGSVDDNASAPDVSSGLVYCTKSDCPKVVGSVPGTIVTPVDDLRMCSAAFVPRLSAWLMWKEA